MLYCRAFIVVLSFLEILVLLHSYPLYKSTFIQMTKTHRPLLTHCTERYAPCPATPLKSLSTPESLQGNGFKVPECNQEPGLLHHPSPFTESWSRSWIFNTGSHFRMSQDKKGRAFCIISTECSGCWRETLGGEESWNQEGWQNWLTGINKHLSTTI